MAHTKEKLISDIILELTQSSPSDDLQLEELQVAYWISLYLNDLIVREINDYKKNGKIIPPIYVRRDVAFELQEEAIADVDDYKQRIYIELTEEVLDLPNDGGIVAVKDYDGNRLKKTSVDELEYIENLQFAKPSPTNVVYYREGKTKIFVKGFNTADLEFNPLMVSYVPKQDVLSMSDGDEILITDQLATILIDLCVEKGKQELYGTTADQTNDGVDNKDIIYHTAIQNPTKSQPQTQQPTE